MRRTYQWIRANFTGLSTPLLGISWQPTPSERDQLRKLFAYLEDRRALHVDSLGRSAHAKAHLDHPEWLRESLLDIRRQITTTVQSAEFPEHALRQLRAIQEACRDRLETPGVLTRSEGHTPYMSFSLSKLHQSVATAVAELASSYELDLEASLSALIESVVKRNLAMSRRDG